MRLWSFLFLLCSFFVAEFYVREAQREVVEEAKAEYNPAAYGMNRAEEQLIAYPVQQRYPEQPQRWSGMHESEIATDPDWIRERDARLEREIQEKEQILDREIREREIRESEQHYEEVTAKRNSRLRAQMSYETGYETQLTPEESAAEQLRYVVTEEEETSQNTGTKTKTGATGSSGSGPAKKRSPRSPRKSQRTSPDTEKPVKKEKRPKKNRSSNVESESEKTGGKSGGSNGKKPVHRHDSSRKSIRRQAKVESSKNTGAPSGASAETGGGAISGADLSDVFDEEYYEQDASDMNFQDRSNCRKK